uniref:Uncharacterized protein n=1 Tax=Vitis vinifera TaxID=29760 RepID=F6I6L8_VITVI
MEGGRLSRSHVSPRGWWTEN